MTQAELGITAGVSQRHISFIETGKAIPSRATIRRIANTLSIGSSLTCQILRSYGFAARESDARFWKDIPIAASSVIDFAVQNHDPLPAVVCNSMSQVVLLNEAGKKLVFLATGEEPSVDEATTPSLPSLLLSASGHIRFLASQNMLVALINSLLVVGACKKMNERIRNEMTCLKSLLDERGELLLAKGDFSPLPVYEAAITKGNNIAEWGVSCMTFATQSWRLETSSLTLQLLIPSDHLAVEQARELFGL